MVTKQQEYQARFFQILGFALMTPGGHLFLKLPEMSLGELNLKMFFYTIISIVLVIVGIIINVKGMEYLEERENRWIQ